MNAATVRAEATNEFAGDFFFIAIQLAVGVNWCSVCTLNYSSWFGRLKALIVFKIHIKRGNFPMKQMAQLKFKLTFLFFVFTECKEDEFRCNDASCIPKSSVCDTRKDCNDGEDEVNCCKYIKSERHLSKTLSTFFTYQII